MGHALGTERLGVSVWELPAGEAAYPYHLHLAEEELVVVLAGTPSSRGPDGWRELERGEVLQGVGGALLLPATVAIATPRFPPTGAAARWGRWAARRRCSPRWAPRSGACSPRPSPGDSCCW